MMSWRLWGPDMPSGNAPLLLLHGSHGGWMHWLRNIQALARERCVIVPDIPGFGESDPPRDVHSREDHARAMVEGIHALGISGPIDVIAFSLGATLACFMSFEAPDLFRRIIMVDAGGLGTPLRTAPVKPLRGVPPEELRDLNRYNLHAMMFHDPSRINETAIDISMFCGRRAKTQVQMQVIPDKLLAAAEHVRVPIDAIWGEHDYMHPDPEVNAEAIRAFQPHARLRVIADAGHWCMYEQADAFNDAALELLALPVHAGRVDARA